MASEHESAVVQEVRTLDDLIRGTADGPTRVQLRASMDRLITALAMSGYTLRRGGPGLELSPAE